MQTISGEIEKAGVYERREVFFGQRETFPETGERQCLYFAADEQRLYCWSGTDYRLLGGEDAKLQFCTVLPETGQADTLYVDTAAGQLAHYTTAGYQTLGGGAAGGIADAPSDGQLYVRRDGEWTKLIFAEVSDAFVAGRTVLFRERKLTFG